MEKDLIDIVGAENVTDSPEILDSYSCDMSFVPPIRPRYVVTPRDRNEVKKLIEWANKTLTPLIPVSSGPPRFRGDTVPSVGGAVIVDLTKMKRVIRVDKRNKVVLVEPGVTWGELKGALAKEGLAPFMPLMPRATKSVVASVLECEPIVAPKHHWDIQDPLATVEVVFGSGDLFRTGDAAGPGDLEEQWKVGKAQSRGLGPTFVDFSKLLQLAQGTLGIVTWASIRCRDMPEIRRAFLIPSDDLSRLIDLTYRLTWRRLGDALFIVNSCNLACIVGKDTYEVLEILKSLPQWLLFVSIEPSGYYVDKKAEIYEEELSMWCRTFGVEPMHLISGISAMDVLTLVSKPSGEPYWKLKLKGGVQEILFLTTMDRVQDFVQIMRNIAGKYGYSTRDIGVYIQPIMQGSSCHCEFDIYYDPRDPTDVETAKKIFYEGARALVRAGAFFARPYGPIRDITYPYIAAPVIILQRKIKAIFDPNNIMNPGKLYYG